MIIIKSNYEFLVGLQRNNMLNKALTVSLFPEADNIHGEVVGNISLSYERLV